MAETATRRMAFISLTQREYNGFTDSTGREVPSGVTRIAYFVGDRDEEPVSVKLPQNMELVSKVEGLAQGEVVVVTFTLYANKDRLQRVMAKLEPADLLDAVS